MAVQTPQSFLDVTDFFAELCATITTLSTGWSPVVSYVFGSEQLQQFSTAPRIGFEIDKAEHRGTQLPGQRMSDPNTLNTPVVERSLATVFPLINAHCWGGPLANDLTIGGQKLIGWRQSWALRNLVVQALRINTASGYELRGETWPETGHETQGRLIILHFGVRMPIPDAQQLYTTITTEDVSNKLADNGGPATSAPPSWTVP